jgi:hypothetical protein
MAFGVLPNLESKGAVALQLGDLLGQLHRINENLRERLLLFLQLLGLLVDHVIIDQALDGWRLLVLQALNDPGQRLGNGECR